MGLGDLLIGGALGYGASELFGHHHHHLFGGDYGGYGGYGDFYGYGDPYGYGGYGGFYPGGFY